MTVNTQRQKQIFFSNLQMDDFRRCQSDVSNVEIPNDIPWMSRIIFTSRTHSQLKQAMKELKSTNYKRMNSAILGSRKQMCINPDVQQTGVNIHSICKSIVKQRKCNFFNNLETLKCDSNFMDEIKGHVLDIEDLVSLGKSKNVCPYFLSQLMAENADIVFSPYNYVLDERIRSKNDLFTLILTNGTIIFDEAHNIPQMCEEISSVEFSSDDILTILADVEYVAALVSNQELLKLNRSDFHNLFFQCQS